MSKTKPTVTIPPQDVTDEIRAVSLGPADLDLAEFNQANPTDPTPTPTEPDEPDTPDDEEE